MAKLYVNKTTEQQILVLKEGKERVTYYLRSGQKVESDGSVVSMTKGIKVKDVKKETTKSVEEKQQKEQE